MWWLLKEPFVLWRTVLSTLCSLSADSAGQLNVLGHDGDALGVDGAQVGVFKQTNKVSLASFLKGHYGGALETQIGLEILSDFSHKTLEGQLADQQLGGFLVTTDLTKSDCTRPVTMRFLDSTGCRSALTSCLCGELFSWSFSTSWFTSSLLCTCHAWYREVSRIIPKQRYKRIYTWRACSWLVRNYGIWLAEGAITK